LIGFHQEVLLKVNPTLVTSARTGNGRSKSGWKLLNQNNVCKDLANPLKYNKSDILVSGTQVLEDSDRIITNMCDQIIDPLQSEATRLVQSHASYAELLKFVEQIANVKWIPRVESSCSMRGAHGFRVPFGEDS
jgi:hypothetical protein